MVSHSVDLPAPFGPMRMRKVPGVSSRLTLVSALKPSKSTVTFSIIRMGAGIAFMGLLRRLQGSARNEAAHPPLLAAARPEQAGHAIGQEHHGEDEQRTQPVEPERGEGGTD